MPALKAKCGSNADHVSSLAKRGSKDSVSELSEEQARSKAGLTFSNSNAMCTIESQCLDRLFQTSSAIATSSLSTKEQRSIGGLGLRRRRTGEEAHRRKQMELVLARDAASGTCEGVGTGHVLSRHPMRRRRTGYWMPEEEEIVSPS